MLILDNRWIKVSWYLRSDTFDGVAVRRLLILIRAKDRFQIWYVFPNLNLNSKLPKDVLRTEDSSN